MKHAVIIDAVRTPVARSHPEKGWFRNIRSDELGVIVVKELIKRTGIAPANVEDLVLGCANQTGEQAMDIARYIAIMAGMPFGVAAQTINRQCASSMTAVHSAAQAIMSNSGDVFIAGGIEHMTHLPEGAGSNLNPKRFDFVDRSSSSMGLTAETLAELYHVTRLEQEMFALRSHEKAILAQQQGRFKDEIVPVEVTLDGQNQIIDRDQNPRSYTSLEIMAALPPIAREGGTVTAATSSLASDGAAALLIASALKARQLGLKPVARVVSMAVAGVDPRIMGLAVVPAAHKAFDRAGLSASDIGLFEINEAFAVVALVAMKELGIPPDKLNPNGGAVALGHPMGATGARMITTLVHEMKRRQVRYGLAAMCVGMGQGAATVVELVG